MSEKQRERLDVVDENDCIVGTVFRDEIDISEIKYLRGVTGFVVNSNGQLWIPCRADNKKFLPGALDMSISGCVSSGESYDQAFTRELKEELSLNFDDVPVSSLGYLTPEHGIKFFAKVYEVRIEEVSNYNRDEIKDGAWYTPAQLEAVLKSGRKAKSDLLMSFKLFYAP